MYTLFRRELVTKLRDWQGGRLSSAGLHTWASELFPHRVVYDDWEPYEGDEESVSNVVLQALDCLDSNLALPDDAPIYLEFLETPPGSYWEGLARFQSRLKSIDYALRRKVLRKDPLYARFCEGSA